VAPRSGSGGHAGDFITVAEETGLIVEIGDHVLRAACRDAASWQCAQRGLRVSVNVSARQLVATDFADKVADVLRQTGLAPTALCLELTEAVLIDAASAAQSLQQLRELGVHLAVDDFRMSYSSLSYLRRFPVDVRKIDRAFVVGLPSSARDLSIVSGIVQLGRSIGMDVVVEGVERADQVAALIELGCKFAQGFAFGAAVAASDVFEPGLSPLRPTPAVDNGVDH
jgi:EAL domain-containing protein (putative c-di-GMP-specific phosphodiesterase class I)